MYLYAVSFSLPVILYKTHTGVNCNLRTSFTSLEYENALYDLLKLNYFGVYVICRRRKFAVSILLHVGSIQGRFGLVMRNTV